MGLTTLASTTAAQGPLPSEMLESLGSSSFVERELVTRKLETDPAITLEQLEVTLLEPSLSAEQRQRLTGAARRRFFNEPRAAMGIMLGSMTDIGLTINGTTVGFPAAEVLQAQDVITSINGLPIRSTADLQVAIISEEPGAIVPVEYLRDNRAQRTDLELGSWRDLNGQRQQQPSYDVMLMAWQYRTRRLREAIDPPRLTTLSGDLSQAMDDDVQPRVPERERRRDVPVMAGQPRDAAARASGIGLDRRLSQSAAERGNDAARQFAKTLLDLQQREAGTRKQLEIAQANLKRAQERTDQRRIDQYQGQVDQHTRVLRLLEDNIRRVKAARARITGP